MKEIISTITSKGQITIPTEVRKHLGVAQGDKLSFVIPKTGVVELRVAQYPTVASLRGAACKPLTPDLTDGEMTEIAYEDRLLATYTDEV